MPDYQRHSVMPAPVGALAGYHERTGAFQRLAPTWERMEVIEQRGTIHDGDTLHFCLKKGPLRLHWRAAHSDYIAGRQFRDTAVQSPFSSWSHLHTFEPRTEETSVLRDSIEWRLPLHPLSLLAAPIVTRLLNRMFDQRHQRTRNDLAVQQRYALPPQRVAISGGTGMIGTALAAFLRTAGHEVSVITRSPDPSDPHAIGWDIDAGTLDTGRLEGMDVVIHLAGAGIADERWSDERKRVILESRTRSTELLARTLSALKSPPRVFISASAVGFYGHRPSGVMNESSSAGDGFLADVCAAWEAAADPARDAGIRVIHPRLGVVISAQGGALPRMMPPFLMGAGGRLGDGRQGMGWISLDDAVYAFYHLMATDGLNGPVNLVSPDPITNGDFTRQLGRALRRPAIVPVPALAIRTLFGEMGQATLLEGALVEPVALKSSGFQWTHPALVDAVRFETGRS